MSPATREEDNNVDNIEKVQIDLAYGVYTIQVTHKATLAGGAQVLSLIANGGTTGLGTNDQDFSDKIVIYPNPAKSQLNFAAPQNVTITSVQILICWANKSTPIQN